ncbi:alpha/beta fold hydrolase [Edaphobacter aggregans]|uniref:alpha/beta fold hydrolase n=1 Tax=Edaphobacter aggregans TaxID=570835 RepID=UPI000558F3A4|nr:alpha/beta hydrolase [Edaphobacter aggregans]
MMRREFLRGTFGVAGASLLSEVAMGLGGGAVVTSPLTKVTDGSIDIREFHRMRRFADLPMARVAYVERGKGPVALFLHGFPLNGYQWRGALERLSPYRRCIAADFMGLGYTHAPADADVSLPAQVEMLAALLDHLKIDEVDLVANDSGGLIAQLFVAKHGSRVRTLLLTNCDVDENSPPAAFVPLIQSAKQPGVADRFIAPQVKDKSFARTDKGLGVAYTRPAQLADETIDVYFEPLVRSQDRKEQFSRYLLAFEPNLLVPIRPQLKEFRKPVHMVWATSDIFFDAKWAEWLDRTLPGSRGVRRIEGAKLFFPEEMPDVIAEEALRLWGISPLPRK